MATLFAVAGVILEQPVIFLFAVPLSILGAAIFRLVNHGKSATEVTRQDEDAQEPALVPHRGWGCVAVALDGLLLVCALLVWAALLTNPRGDFVPRGSASDYVALAICLAIVVAHTYAHREAVRPAVGKAANS
ncbi:hypothetical protein ACFY1P_20010 [Streptomyces sp. NPDC001407]|uniref:hypothetical protein n=1 Tax=Streptomyces sp. NPDC001407 TaxID=3364573 RepID=UPI00369D1AF6